MLRLEVFKDHFWIKLYWSKYGSGSEHFEFNGILLVVKIECLFRVIYLWQLLDGAPCTRLQVPCFIVSLTGVHFCAPWISWLMFCKLKIDNKILTHQFGSAFKNSCRASFNYFLPNFNLWIVSWTIEKQYYLLMNKMHLIILLMQITPTLHFFVEANSFFIIFLILKRILNICCSYLLVYLCR